MSAPFETIRYDRRLPVGIVTLNRPDRLNAMNGTMVGELLEVLDEVENDEAVRVLILCGEGRAFSAGFDLKESAARERHGIADWQPDIQRAYDMTVGFWRLTKPTIAAVHKYCLAGATELALSCDITIASEGTRFGEPELRFGAGIAVMVMPWLTGPKKAKQWLLTGNDRIDATEAYQWGMINEVVPEGEHLETALAMARQIALMDPQAVRITKQAINRSFDIMGMRDALDMSAEMALQIYALDTPERRKFTEISRERGLQAALDWREARYSGKDGDSE